MNNNKLLPLLKMSTVSKFEETTIILRSIYKTNPRDVCSSIVDSNLNEDIKHKLFSYKRDKNTTMKRTVNHLLNLIEENGTMQMKNKEHLVYRSAIILIVGLLISDDNIVESLTKTKSFYRLNIYQTPVINDNVTHFVSFINKDNLPVFTYKDNENNLNRRKLMNICIPRNSDSCEFYSRKAEIRFTTVVFTIELGETHIFLTPDRSDNFGIFEFIVYEFNRLTKNLRRDKNVNSYSYSLNFEIDGRVETLNYLFGIYHSDNRYNDEITLAWKISSGEKFVIINAEYYTNQNVSTSYVELEFRYSEGIGNSNRKFNLNKISRQEYHMHVIEQFIKAFDVLLCEYV